MPPFVHLVADYGPADPAFSEVVHRLVAAEPDIRVETTAVPPFSTVATGFWVEQLGCHNPAFDGLTIYANAAPRTDDPAENTSGDGGPLCYAELDTGVPVVGVDAGYSFSFVRDRIVDFRAVETPREGSQFRSRDFFPEPVAEIARGDHGSLGAERPVDGVPPPPTSVVCHVDGYGNVKTSVRASALDATGGQATAEIGGERRPVAVEWGVTEVGEGELGVVPGSAGGADPYVEIVRRGGSAAAAFDDPEPGDSVGIDAGC